MFSNPLLCSVHCISNWHLLHVDGHLSRNILLILFLYQEMLTGWCVVRHWAGCSLWPWREWGHQQELQGTDRWSQRCQCGSRVEAGLSPAHTEIESDSFSYELQSIITTSSSNMCVYLVQARGHDEESRRGLVTSGGCRGRQVVALQDLLVLRLALVKLIVLTSDTGHLKHVPQHLPSYITTMDTTPSIYKCTPRTLPPALPPGTHQQLTFLPLQSIPRAMGRPIIHDDLQGTASHHCLCVYGRLSVCVCVCICLANIVKPHFHYKNVTLELKAKTKFLLRGQYFPKYRNLQGGACSVKHFRLVEYSWQHSSIPTILSFLRQQISTIIICS